MRRLALAICASTALAVVPSAALAQVTYHFSQSAAALDSRGGLFTGGVGPVTFDFSVATALAANKNYNFGFSPISKGDSGSVLSFAINGGNSYSNFTSADFPSHYTYYASGRDTGVVIHLETDAAGAIAVYDIIVHGQSVVSPQDYLVFQLQNTSANRAVAVVESTYNTTYGYSSGYLQCVAGCGGGFTAAAGGVPEPASWGMLITGLGAVGAALRRRRGRPARVAIA